MITWRVKLGRRWTALAMMVLLAAGLLPGLPSTSTYAQPSSRTFPQTGKTVQGKFLAYWDTHGGLAQQGYPISDEMSEVSETDGKIYTVQYFERAVFELHPENPAPNDVLLSLLGVFFYQQKYGSAGASGQVPNTSSDSVEFPQTNHRLGGKFLAYWKSHGGLPQQGYPISDEFIETSPTDGKQYRVQYFERAVFEDHPENQPPNDVLLSLLGVQQLQRKTAPKPTATTAPARPTATPTSAPPPPTAVADCSQGVPDAKDATITPKCGPIGTVFQISARGFTPGERISYWITLPSGVVAGTPRPLDIGEHSGSFTGSFDSSILAGLGSQVEGIWAVTYQGEQSNHQSIVWFKIVSNAPPPATPGTQSCDTSGNRNGESRPSSGHVGDTLFFTARGFTPGEPVSFWFTLPNGQVFGTPAPVPPGFVNPDGTIGPLPFTILQSDITVGGAGRWAITFQGASSNNQAIIYFCIAP